MSLQLNLFAIQLLCFYIKSRRKDCEYCEAFIKTKEFKLLPNLRSVLNLNVQYFYHELPCDWEWMYEKRYTDKKYEESGYTLKSWTPDMESRNYQYCLTYTDKWPSIVIHLFFKTPKGDEVIRTRILKQLLVPDNSTKEGFRFNFFDILKGIFHSIPGAVQQVRYIQHGKAGKKLHGRANIAHKNKKDEQEKKRRSIEDFF